MDAAVGRNVRVCIRRLAKGMSQPQLARRLTDTDRKRGRCGGGRQPRGKPLPADADRPDQIDKDLGARIGSICRGC